MTQRNLTINEQDWDDAGLLMPPELREEMHEQQTADERLLHREFADGNEQIRFRDYGAGNSDQDILLPGDVYQR